MYFKSYQFNIKKRYNTVEQAQDRQLLVSAIKSLPCHVLKSIFSMLMFCFLFNLQQGQCLKNIRQHTFPNQIQIKFTFFFLSFPYQSKTQLSFSDHLACVCGRPQWRGCKLFTFLTTANFIQTLHKAPLGEGLLSLFKQYNVFDC